MKKNNSSKTISVLAIVVAIVGLTIGFAVYSSTIKIDNLNVKPNKDTFVVKFSSSEKEVDENKPIKGVSSNGAWADEARIVSGGETAVAYLKARFTAPGQKVTYTLYAHNKGNYDAFLRTITFANAVGANTSKACRPYDSNTSVSLVREACEAISLTVQVGESVKTSGSLADISGHSLEVDDNEPIIITIEYGADGARADGQFEVEFGKVTLTYLSINEDGYSTVKSRVQS